jgi:hypothetical protein
LRRPRPFKDTRARREEIRRRASRLRKLFTTRRSSSILSKGDTSLGMDHTKLTYRYAGRDFRLTDVYGDVVTDVLA